VASEGPASAKSHVRAFVVLGLGPRSHAATRIPASWALPGRYATLFALAQATPSNSPARSAALRPDDGRLERGRRSLARIRTAARELFRESGFDRATLRAIGARAGMGASSIYRHVRSKHELLVLELADLQERAWREFRLGDDPRQPSRERLTRFLELQHALLACDADLTLIALRATTHPEARVARRALALNDRTIGLVAEVLQSGRRRDLSADLDVLAAARAVVHITTGARIAWANGLSSEDACRSSIAVGVDLLFQGIAAGRPAEVATDPETHAIR